MSAQLFSSLKSKAWLPSLFSFVVLLLLAACGGAPPAEVPAPEVSIVEVENVVEADTPAQAEGETQAEASPAESFRPAANRPDIFNRQIIKNAEVALLVKDTDIAINRTLGIVTEYDGYVISQRTWFEAQYKQATLTLGVPVANFEEMLRRLKDLAISVSNEVVSGEDVTDQFVDLESRLRNLEATSGRIREFLKQAATVEESLKVNEQLAAIDAEIEQVKGQMAYLRDRAAFSTITLQLAPQIPEPTPLPTPTPTPTPEPWSAAGSFNRAAGVTNRLATNLFQTGVDLVIWVVVVIFPFSLPLLGFIWGGLWLLRRLVKGRMLSS